MGESHITESIASTDTVKVEEGVPVDAETLGRASGVLHRHIGKREADAGALHGTVATTLYNTRISKPIKKVGHPDCVSTPVRSARTSPTPTRGTSPGPSVT